MSAYGDGPQARMAELLEEMRERTEEERDVSGRVVFENVGCPCSFWVEVCYRDRADLESITAITFYHDEECKDLFVDDVKLEEFPEEQRIDFLHSFSGALFAEEDRRRFAKQINEAQRRLLSWML